MGEREEKLIEGVRIEPLKEFSDERGKVMHMLRSDSPLFIGFGEVYFSYVNPGVVKAWKKHTRMTLHYAAPRGNIKVVIYDGREGSRTKGEIQEITIGEDNYILLRIPPMVWSGFQGISPYPSLVCNCTDIPHSPDEALRLPPDSDEIPYIWGKP